MTKADLVNEISKKTGIDKVAVAMTVESFMEEVKKAMIADKDVFLRGFGSFVVKTRAEKTARNILKNTTGKWEQTANATLLQGLQDEAWDIITMQQSSGKSGLPDTYDIVLQELIDYVNANKTNHTR